MQKIPIVRVGTLIVVFFALLLSIGVAQAHRFTVSQRNVPDCAPIKGTSYPASKTFILSSSQITVPDAATTQSHTGANARIAPDVDGARWDVYIWVSTNVCGVITEVKGQCITTAAPAAEIFEDCILEKNESTVWNPGYQLKTGTSFSQASAWYAAGSSGTTWSCAISSEVAFPDGGLLFSPNYPIWGLWVYKTVN
jgi:hypothetical protein